MIKQAEKEGKIKPGFTLIEATSGNTGIGISFAAKLLGYKSIILMPEKASSERQCILELLGAKIVRTPTEVSHDHPESMFSVSRKLNQQIKNSFILDQWNNQENVKSHHQRTAIEILAQCENRVDYIFAGTGTGGTITGIGKRVRECLPTCKVIGVDPKGSVLAQPDSLNVEKEKWQVEGYGYDFVPGTLDRSVVS